MAENHGGSHWRVIYPRRQLPPATDAKVKKRPKAFKKVLVLVAGILVIAAVVAISRPLPSPQPASTFDSSFKPTNIALPLTSYGESAVAASGYGVLAGHASKTPVPMASIAKVITALAVLEQRPLAVGTQGPKITITQEDLGFYDDYFNKGGSVAAVQVGEEITEYQALQALLIPSANNFADSLARWAFGSPKKYVSSANNFVKTLGMSSTNLADASGLAPDSTATAEDLIALGQAALAQPVVAEIIKQDKATLPVAGEAISTNALLGIDGIMGIKTGNTDEAGGCFLFSAKRQVENRPVTVIGVILGAPSLTAAMNDSRPLLRAVDKGFKLVSIVQAGQAVGRYDLPWGGSVPVVAQKQLATLAWQPSVLQSSVTLSRLSAPKAKGAVVGSLNITSNEKIEKVPLVLSKPLKGPTLSWRIFR